MSTCTCTCDLVLVLQVLLLVLAVLVIVLVLWVLDTCLVFVVPRAQKIRFYPKTFHSGSGGVDVDRDGKPADLYIVNARSRKIVGFPEFWTARSLKCQQTDGFRRNFLSTACDSLLYSHLLSLTPI